MFNISEKKDHKTDKKVHLKEY